MSSGLLRVRTEIFNVFSDNDTDVDEMTARRRPSMEAWSLLRRGKPCFNPTIYVINLENEHFAYFLRFCHE